MKIAGNNLTTLETKIIGGKEPYGKYENDMKNALASIEVNQVHMWTGIVCQDDMVYTTAKIAQEIRGLMQRRNAECVIKVCYYNGPANKKCVSIISIGLNAQYLSYNFQHGCNAIPFNPHDIAILKVSFYTGWINITNWIYIYGHRKIQVLYSYSKSGIENKFCTIIQCYIN